MGSWNETCLVTQLAIMPGDAVRLFVIVERPHGISGGGFHYPSDAWAPLSVPIRGEYADYGDIGDCQFSALHEYVLSTLKAEWVDPPRDHFDATPDGYADTLTWAGVLNAVERGIAATKRGALGQAMVHEDVYQSMVVGVRDVQEWWSDGVTVGEDIRRKVVAALEVIKTCGSTFVLHDVGRLLGDLGMVYTGVLEYIANRADRDTLVEEIVDFACFSYAMRQMRKFYSPQPGKGSQHDEHNLHIAVGAVVTGIIGKRRAEVQADDSTIGGGHG